MKYSEILRTDPGLRNYQADAKRKIFEAWDECASVLLQMPTGTGKTFLFTSVVKDILDYYKAHHIELNVLVAVHRMELIDQISDSLHKYGIPHGIIQGSRAQQLWQRIQVGSIQSLLTSKNEMNVQRLDFDYIIVDEAHHSLADTYKRLFETFPNAKKLGVTATPWRLNHESFLPLYDQLIVSPQIQWFIKQKVLADFDYVSIKPDSQIQRMINNTEVAQTGDFVNRELDNAFNVSKIRSKLYASYRNFALGRKGIVYAINREHAANVAALYNSKGENAVAIDCETPKDERRMLIDAFKRGEIKVLVNVDIFTEGFDCPDVSFIQLARPTKSLALYLQQVGRGLRMTEGKEKTIILDNVGLYNYFGLPDANRQWRRHFVGQEEPDDLGFGERDAGLEREPRERDYTEDDEEMMVVRGADHIKPMPSQDEPIVPVTKPPVIEEFQLCDYYLVIGHEKKFKVYPFIKKRGKVTDGVGNSVLEYDDAGIVFTRDSVANQELLARFPKAQVVIFFAATICGIETSRVINLKHLCDMAELPKKSEMSLFELLKTIEAIYQKRN